MTWHTQSSISNIGKQYSLSYLGLPVSSSFRVTGLKKRERASQTYSKQILCSYRCMSKKYLWCDGIVTACFKSFL